jgi:O-antigen/teichoic acid export membrane protein
MTGPALLIVWLTTYGDRFIMEHFLDLKSVGEYSFLVTICSIAELIFFALNSAFQPYIFDHFSTNKANVKNYYKVFIILSIISVSFLIVLCTNIDMIIKNDEFLTTLPLTIPLLAAFIFSAVSNLYALQITFAQKGRYYLMLSVIVLVSNIALNFLLIPGNGVKGAVGATILTKVVMAIFVIYFSQKSLSTPTLRETAMLVGFFIFIEYLVWTIATLHWVNFRTAAFIQLIVLGGGGLFFYKRQIRSYLNFT